MNAAAPLDVNPTAHALVVRDRRFGRDAALGRWWLNGDPVATAWFNALSATFPRGETLFIDSVKAFRDEAPPRLAAEIRAFHAAGFTLEQYETLMASISRGRSEMNERGRRGR